MWNPFKKEYSFIKPRDPVFGLQVVKKVNKVLIAFGGLVFILDMLVMKNAEAVTAGHIANSVLVMAGVAMMIHGVHRASKSIKETTDHISYQVYLRKINFYNAVFNGKPLKDIPPYDNNDDIEAAVVNMSVGKFIGHLEPFKDHKDFNPGAFMKIKLQEHLYPKAFTDMGSPW